MKRTKQFVHCFQQVQGAPPPPFVAELIETKNQKAMIKVGNKTFTVHRAACSTVSYSREDMEKYGQKLPGQGGFSP